MPLEMLLHQPRIPVFTGISLLTSAAVESVLLWIGAAVPGQGTNAIGAFVLGAFLVLVGGAINTVTGWIAHRRREYWGGRIASIGTAAWFATILVFLFS